MSDTIKIFDLMCKKFTIARDDRTKHNTCIAELAEVYNDYDSKKFYKAYEKCIKIPLSYEQKDPQIENALEFGALLAVKLIPKVKDNDTESPFLKRVFKFILKMHDAKLIDIRYRICYFLTLILNSMEQDAHLSIDLYNNIIDAMLLRIIDKSEKVRIQAVYALRRMQKAWENECNVIKAYIFNLTHDPSPDVRKAVIRNIVENKKTVQSMIERVHDVDDSVRKLAYLFLAKIMPTSLEREQLRKVLNNGLQDTNNGISKVVAKLLEAWLLHEDNKITKLLYALDIEMDIGIDVGIIVLDKLFEILTVDDLVEQLPINQEKKLIPIVELSSENVLFWHCYLKYLKKSTDLFNQKLPKLSDFCDHIRAYCEKIINNESTEENYHKISEQFILCQLLEMTKLYDLSDETEKKYLKRLLKYLLKSDIPEIKLIELIVQIYEKVIPNETTRANILTRFINTIGIPCDETSKMSKCLHIMCSLLRSATITELTSDIRVIFDRILITYQNKHDDKYVQVQLLNAVGLCLLLDAELADKHIEIFLMILKNDNDSYEEKIMALGFIFDLFVTYGLDHFDLVDPDTCDTTPRNHLIGILLLFLEHQEPRVQLTAVRGFINLLLSEKIKDDDERMKVVSRLIILLHMPYCCNNPQYEGAVASFFNLSLSKENKKILEKLFLPIIREILDAKSESKLYGIDSSIVGHFILTSLRHDKSKKPDYTAHNNISYNMLKEIINSENKKYVKILLKCLAYVQIKITDEALQKEMLTMCDAVIKNLSEMETLKIFEKFYNSLKRN